MGKKIRAKKYLLILISILFLLIFVKFLVLFHTIKVHPERIWKPDSITYHNPALSLLEYGKFSVSLNHPDFPETIRTPGYPLFMAFIYYLFGVKPWVVILFQILLSTLTVIMVFDLGKRLVSPSVGFIASIFLLLDPVSFYYSEVLLTETLFTFLITLTIWSSSFLFLYKNSNQKPRLIWAIVAGISLAFATLTRPISYYLIFFVLLFFIIWLKKRAFGIRFSILIFMAIMLPSLIFVGGWQFRNFKISGSYELSNIKGYNILFYTGAYIIAQRDGIPFVKAQRDLKKIYGVKSGLTEPETFKKWEKIGIKIIKNNPFIYFKSFIKGVIGFFKPGTRELIDFFFPSYFKDVSILKDFKRLTFKNFLKKYFGLRDRFLFFSLLIESFYLFLLYLLFLIGVVVSLNKRNFLAVHLFILGLFLYFVIISAMALICYCRFRMPVVPIIALYAGIGLNNLIRQKS